MQEARYHADFESGADFLRAVRPGSFLQYVGAERKTCAVNLWNSDGQQGAFQFEDGQPIDAELGGEHGMAAAFRMLSWPQADAQLAPAREVGRQHTLQCSLAELLLEAARRVEQQPKNREMAAGEGSQAADDGSGAPPRSDQSDGVEKGAENVNSLQKVVDRFRDDVPEFVSTDIVNIESGLSIGGGTADPDFDASVASASYAEVVKSNRRALDLLGLGENSTEDILITTQRVYILVRLLGGAYFQVLAITRRGNLGLARAIMKKYEPELLGAVGDLS